MTQVPAFLIGKKIGMTRFFDETGKNIPVTVIQAGPCFVSQVKTSEKDGYDALQLAFDDVKARNSTQPVIGHDGKAGLGPKRHHREVRCTSQEVAGAELGKEVSVASFESVKFVDVVGTSKGKGFAGTMKRHNFKGMCASHGTERKHRSPGSIGGHATNRGFSGRPKKGKRMSGHLGDERVTVRSLEVVGRDAEKNLLIVKGPVPGSNQSLLMIKEAVRLYKTKAKVAKAS
ncbi:MAG: 50S ribosomal protein L3 [Phycisphaera sp.]|nr:50S ribosomal protein L3 [Phycisphaera sp.]